MQIDTTSAQYQQYLTGLSNLRTLMAPRFALFKKLPQFKQRQWLQKDPLFRKVIKMGVLVGNWTEQFKGDVEND